MVPGTFRKPVDFKNDLFAPKKLVEDMLAGWVPATTALKRTRGFFEPLYPKTNIFYRKIQLDLLNSVVFRSYPFKNLSCIYDLNHKLLSAGSSFPRIFSCLKPNWGSANTYWFDTYQRLVVKYTTLKPVV